jgi:hypothetical protein
MAPKYETPTDEAGASRESLEGTSRDCFTLTTYRLQYLAARYALPVETAAIVAALAFAGGAHHG